MRRFAVIVLMAAALLPGCTSAASRPISSLLPKGAHVVSQAKIAGYRDAVAVAYSYRGSKLAVALLSSGRPRVLWSSTLGSVAKKVLSPGPTGVFVVVTAGSGSGSTVSAYRLHGGKVSWALADGKGRPIAAASLTAARRTLTVTNPDTAHQGSVPYQFTTSYHWQGSTYGPGTTVHEPALAPSAYPVPNGVVHLANGDTVLMKLETAWTLAQQEYGLMNRPSLDADSGMVFVWPDLVSDTFTMSNTEIPLSIAFLAPDGTILDILEMKAEDSQTPYFPNPSRCVSGNPGRCYQYAIEMNKGFFANNNIQIGDKVQLSLPCSTFRGFQSSYVKCYS